MKISYDSEIDAIYIRLLDGKHECRSVRLSEEVALNIGANEKLVGIEILDASEVLGSGGVPSVVLEGLESVTGALTLRDKAYKKAGSKEGPSGDSQMLAPGGAPAFTLVGYPQSRVLVRPPLV